MRGYYKGDIVEVLTARHASMNEWKKDEEYWRLSGQGALLLPYIGLRFRVSVVNGDQVVWDRTGNPDQIAIFHPDELKLYHRPFINVIKSLFRIPQSK